MRTALGSCSISHSMTLEVALPKVVNPRNLRPTASKVFQSNTGSREEMEKAPIKDKAEIKASRKEFSFAC
jgi:hypothetical protein